MCHGGHHGCPRQTPNHYLVTSNFNDIVQTVSIDTLTVYCIDSRLLLQLYNIDTCTHVHDINTCHCIHGIHTCTCACTLHTLLPILSLTVHVSMLYSTVQCHDIVLVQWCRNLKSFNSRSCTMDQVECRPRYAIVSVTIVIPTYR